MRKFYWVILPLLVGCSMFHSQDGNTDSLAGLQALENKKTSSSANEGGTSKIREMALHGSKKVLTVNLLIRYIEKVSTFLGHNFSFPLFSFFSPSV